ncbi:MAG: site-specific integrase [Methanogenium sp.]|jgi:integrase
MEERNVVNVKTFSRKELKKAYEGGLIPLEEYKNKLFEIENKPLMHKKKERKIPKCVREEDFISLIKIIPKKDFFSRVGFLLGYGSGMRVSEIVKCSKDHFKVNSIFIPESKYGVERIVPIPKGWKEEFMKYLPLSKYGKGNKKVESSIRKLQRRFEKYKTIAKLPKYYTIHSLRHGFGTRNLERGMPINQVQLLMGHSNIATTSIYLKANPIDAIKSYEDLF